MPEAGMRWDDEEEDGGLVRVLPVLDCCHQSERKEKNKKQVMGGASS